MIDLRIDMVWTSGKHYDITVIASSERYGIASFLLHAVLKLLIGEIGVIAGSLNILERNIHLLGFEIFKHFLIEDTLILKIYVGIQKLYMSQIHISFHNLRIIGNDRAVEMIVSHVLIDVVGHAWIENCLQALIDERLNMTVHQLGRITDRITWNRMLSKGIQCLAGTIAQDDLIAKIGKEGMPEGKVVIQIQNKRNPDFPPDAGNPLQLQQLLIFIIIQIRQLFLIDLSGHRTLTLVAGDMLCPVRKGVYGQIAVIGAQSTMKGL